MPYKRTTVEHATVGLASKEAAEDLLGTAFTQDALEFLGKGVGATKTTTAIHGSTIVEEFGVNDAVYLHWQVPLITDFTKSPVLHFEWAPTTSEVGRLLSVRFDLSPQESGDLINAVGTEFNVVGIVVPATAFQSFDMNLALPVGFITSSKSDLHIKVTRVASGADSVGDVALHHVSIEYQKHQK
jgi:hypothetical protein